MLVAVSDDPNRTFARQSDEKHSEKRYCSERLLDIARIKFGAEPFHARYRVPPCNSDVVDEIKALGSLAVVKRGSAVCLAMPLCR